MNKAYNEYMEAYLKEWFKPPKRVNSKVVWYEAKPDLPEPPRQSNHKRNMNRRVK